MGRYKEGMGTLATSSVRRLALLLVFAVVSLGVTTLPAQTVFNESFTGTSATGWVFGGSTGSTAPYLTASNGTDTAGNGWLRLTENQTNQATFALLDNTIFSVNAQIQIQMDYAFWNGSGADGITFFLVDGNTNSSTFAPGSYGGSMGYGQKTGVEGITGGYLGFALDNYGNFSNGSEGRNGGITNDATLYPNRVAVRGPESSDYEFIAASGALSQQMDFPTATTRPNQTGVDYRSFRITLDANNQLTVDMKFGTSGTFNTVLSADLSSYDRPDTFKLGFTGSTGGSTEIHEIRNLSVTMTPWQAGSAEWSGAAGTSDAATAGNWVGNTLPTADADVLFGSTPSSGPQTVTSNYSTSVRSVTFDSPYNYTINGSGTMTLGNTSQAGLPSINVNDYNGAQAQHHINMAVSLAEELRINNYSFSTLCLNGTFATNGNDFSVNGTGAVNFNSDITGSGDLVKNGSGVVTINNNNADGSAWSGNITINSGMVAVTTDGALGSTTGTTTVNNGGTLAFRANTSNVNYATTESVTIAGNGIWRGGEGQVGAIYNDGGNNTFAGGITMSADAGIGSRDGVLTLTGRITDTSANSFSLTKLGDGVIELTNANNSNNGSNYGYSGSTNINGGVLRVSTDQNALAGGFTTDGYNGGNLRLNGGVLESNVGTTFARQLGTGNDQVQWTGDGGFSAYGGARTVTLTNSAGTANGTLTWNAGSFVPTGNALVLSSGYADNTVTLTNAINFGGAQREVRVANGSAAVDGVISGNLTNGGLVKAGTGTLSLTGTNTYSGATEIQGGALRGNVSANSNLQLNGGVLEISSNYTNSLGTGAANVQWTGSGGFAAYTNNSSVSLNNNTNAVTWASTAGFVGSNGSLILGSASADKTLTFNNAINLNGANRTVQAVQGTAAGIANGVLAGVVSNGSLTVVGNGRLDATAANTLAGTVTVKGAELRLQGAGTMTSVTGITVREGGTLTLDNGTTNDTNRVNNAATVNLNGGTLSFLGRTGNNNSLEAVGALTLSGGGNTVNNSPGDASGSAQLTFASVTRNSGATVDFTNAIGTVGNTGDNPRTIFTSAPTASTSGVLAYATVNGTSFAGYASVNNSNPDGIYAITGTNTAETSWTSSINAATTASQALTANRTVGSLTLGSGINVTQSGSRTLTIDSGGILSTGAGASTISASNLQVAGTGTRELIAHVNGTGGLTINSAIQNNSNTTGLTKAGTGTLTLGGSSANTYTGTTYVNDGTLVLNKSANTTAVAGNLVIGDGRNTDVVQINADEQIANTATVTLNGSSSGSGESILRLNGSSTAGITESFATLSVDGAGIVDFAGGSVCDANFLFLDNLSITAGSTLTIRNWIDYTDFLLVSTSALAGISNVLGQIQFEGYGSGAYWQEYDATYSRITPVPEPSTYGALLLAASAGLMGYRRWKRRNTA